MTTWPPKDLQTFRVPIVPRTPFERAMRRKPPAPVHEPEAIVQAMMPPPGVPIIWCRCGAAIESPRGRSNTQLDREYRDNFVGKHATSLVHRVVHDEYRASCKQHVGGCRECGKMPAGQMRFYCSAACREKFERDHFWDTARQTAVMLASTYAITPEEKRYWRRGDAGGHYRDATYCARCSEPIEGTEEVNHKVPLNGNRPLFGCVHHQTNLEVLDHLCHVATTAAQRAAGLIR